MIDCDNIIVNFPFLDGYVPRRASYGVYISPDISQLMMFVRVCNHVPDIQLPWTVVKPRPLKFQVIELSQPVGKVVHLNSKLRKHIFTLSYFLSG